MATFHKEQYFKTISYFLYASLHLATPTQDFVHEDPKHTLLVENAFLRICSGRGLNSEGLVWKSSPMYCSFVLSCWKSAPQQSFYLLDYPEPASSSGS